MKIDAMSAGALAFAAFAAYVYLKPNPKAPATAASGAALGMLSDQRQQVGAALWQNADYLKGAGFSTAGISEWTLPGYFVPQLGSGA